MLYELHVKGFTMRNPAVPEGQRGTYAGLASEAAIAHLQQLGVTAVSLLPVHQHLDEQRLVAMGLSNYWGYNTIGFFCPDPALASGQSGVSARDEFRAMVARLHAAGIEVILDVVYNHTAESDELGPTLSAGAASTMRATTACRRTRAATTRTTPAAATRSTCASRA